LREFVIWLGERDEVDGEIKENTQVLFQQNELLPVLSTNIDKVQ
jgi:hypothetical protein